MSRQTLYRNLTNTLYIYQNKTYLVSCLASGCPLKRVPHLWCLVSMGSSCSSRNSPKAPILSDTSHITSSYHSSLFVQKAIRSQGSRFGLYSVMLRYQYFWLSRAWKTLCGGKWQAIGVAAAGCTFAVHFQLLSSSGPGILKNVFDLASPTQRCREERNNCHLCSEHNCQGFCQSQHVNPSWSCS